MNATKKATAGALLAVALGLFLAAASASAAGPAPAWSLTLSPMPSNFRPAASPEPEYLIAATNVGAKATEGSSTVTLTLPAGLTPTKASFRDLSLHDVPCPISGQEVSCQVSESIDPGRLVFAVVKVAVSAPEGVYEAVATVSGGGAGQEVKAISPTPVQSGAVPFGFLPGFAAAMTGEAGEAAALAGSHPYQQTVSFNFPTRISGNELTNDGAPRDIWVEMPQGWAGNPAATPVLCTEVELEIEGCPETSQIGVFNITTALGRGTNGILISGLYNMVPPPGTVAELGSDVGGVGIYAHIYASVRSDSDYGVEAITHDVIGFPTIPIFGIQAQLWGDPSAASHTASRECLPGAIPCPIADRETAFLTAPASCPGRPSGYEVLADSWQQPFPEFERPKATYEGADLQGTPVSMAGCGQLPYTPTISARPSTDQADSPSGLEFTLHQPQDMRFGDRAGGELREARVTLPAGMVVNPSQAAGLGACSEAQIGFLGESHYSKAPQSCPDAAKIGTVEVTTPLLAQTEADGTKVAVDPETGQPIPRPLKGSVYLAKPFENQFGSLLAIYLAIEDPRTGIVSKLAGRVQPDPLTGQLTTVFTESPELPLEDVRLSLFKGARAPLITPLVCGAHATTSDLTPWSATEAGVPIEGAVAHPESSFQTTGEPGGGPCPSSESAAANSPRFTAGTESAQAGAYSPFVLKLSREDGSARLTKIDTTLAPGLTGKLAGIAECSDAQIAQAEARSNPEEGALEKASPSCPASTQVGSVAVAAGAGPTPFYTQGTAYLAGPYKGAPLSLAIITPAIAGPFDLGTVVVRTALYVTPETAQIHAVSDPFPTILDGIPLDLRSVALKMDRPDFTLNPTSCNPMAITGSATSALGQAAPLTVPFQVGGCRALPFKPKLTLRLKGKVKRSGNPKLIATLKAKPGEANIAKASVALPHSEFLDQSHIRTVCTRVQFAAGAGHGAECPPGSVYGRARAVTPLLDRPLEGPVYLRSSDHQLPDLVAALNGQIDIDLDGTVDSVRGGIRNRFEVVPDAPVSKFVLEMQGGKKGLLENSTNLCASVNRATVDFTGQNGKTYNTRPALKVKCPRRHGGHKKQGKHHAARGQAGR